MDLESDWAEFVSKTFSGATATATMVDLCRRSFLAGAQAAQENEDTNGHPTVIDPNLLYSLREAQRVTGLGKKSFSVARQRGLRVVYYGRRGFVKGAELVNFIVKQGKEDFRGADAEREDNGH